MLGVGSIDGLFESVDAGDIQSAMGISGIEVGT